MAQQTIYRKVGDEYEPIGEYEPEWGEYFPHGINMIVAENGCQMYRYNVDPNFAGLLGAGLICRDRMVGAIRDATAALPTREPTDRALELWAQLQLEMDGFRLTSPSLNSIADAIIAVLAESFQDTVQDPGARAAFEKFLTIAYLTKE
jgi:hypothetical protein